MIFVKVTFWLMAAGASIGLIRVCQDHPREQTPNNIGTDLVIWIINSVLSIGLGYYIWC